MREWMLDELAHAGHEHLDAGYVATYETKAGYDPAGDVEILRRHGLDAGATVVDLGAGTGQFAVAAAEVCREVVAVDVSPAMVDVMRRRVDMLGLRNVAVVTGGYLSYDHGGRPADVVFSRHALHQLPDFWKGLALARVHAMLRPGGTFRLRDLVYDFEPHEVPERIDAWLAGATTDSAHGWTAAELAEHVREEHGTFRWLLEPLLEHAGFEILDAVTTADLYAALHLPAQLIGSAIRAYARRVDGVHDMGGMHGFGRVVTADGGLTHHEPWEVRAQVIGVLSGGASRGSIEGLDPATYLASSYYVRWLLAAETTLLRRGQVDAGELAQWRETFERDVAAQPPVSSDPATVDAIRAIGPHRHGPLDQHAFRSGDRVRVRRMRPERHHRCPRYLRGAVGEVEKVLGADPVPGLPSGEAVTEACYTVRFSSVDLFGDRTVDGEPRYALYIDLWERYLEEPV